MLNPEDVYNEYLKAKSRFTNTPYIACKKFPPESKPAKWTIVKPGAKRAIRIFTDEFEAKQFMKDNRGKGYRTRHQKGQKMSGEYLKTLDTLALWFNTKWQNIRVEEYFDCGFEIYQKNFYYERFLDPKIIRLYIQKDKNIKRTINISKKNIIDSAKFVKSYMNQAGYKTFHIYCSVRKNNKCLPVYHYLQNKIDSVFLIWLIWNKTIVLTDEERPYIPYIIDNYRKVIIMLQNMRPFLKKVKEYVLKEMKNGRYIR